MPKECQKYKKQTKKQKKKPAWKSFSQREKEKKITEPLQASPTGFH